MIRSSHTDRDFRKFINSFIFLSDLSLEHDEIIMEEKLQKIMHEEYSTNDV